MNRKTVCKKCGVVIDAGKNGRREYCDKCRVIVRRKSVSNSKQKSKLNPDRPKRTIPLPALSASTTYTIVDLNAMARELGITYGQLVSRMRNES